MDKNGSSHFSDDPILNGSMRYISSLKRGFCVAVSKIDELMDIDADYPAHRGVPGRQVLAQPGEGNQGAREGKETPSTS